MNHPHPSSPFPTRLPILALALAATLALPVLGQSSANSTAGNSTAPAPAASNSTAAPANLTAYFGSWPAGADPKVVGTRVAENVVVRKFRYETNPRNAYVIYPEAIAWYGGLNFAHATGNTALADAFVRKFDYFLTPAAAPHISANQTVDYHVFGVVPLEIYLVTHDQKYLPVGLHFADDQFNSVYLPDGTYSKEARFWVDDLYMLPILQLQAYRATGDKKYLDHTAQLFTTYIDKLQEPTGLFYHGLDAPYYWGRGNGWVAAGLSELLTDLPANDPLRPHLMDAYRKMMAALKLNQGPDGLWRQLMDHPESWSETSGSAMFTFALVTGVKNGWLDAPAYGPVARTAWLALVGKLDADANLQDVCSGTNKYPPRLRPGEVLLPVQYYLTRPTDNGGNLTTFDELHGMAPMLWTATALVR